MRVVAVLVWALNFLKISIEDATSWLTRGFCKGMIQTTSALPASVTQAVAVAATKAAQVASVTPAFVSTARTQFSMISAQVWTVTQHLLEAQLKVRSSWKRESRRRFHLKCKKALLRMSTYQLCLKQPSRTQMLWSRSMSLSLESCFKSVQRKKNRHKEIKSKLQTEAMLATLALE